jgi:VanZ family protein
MQLLRPGRHAYLTDVFINAGGACGGIWLGTVLSRLWDRRGGH